MLWLWLFAACGPADAGSAPAPHLLPPPPPMTEVDPFVWETPPTSLEGNPGKIELRLLVPAGMHVYRDQIEVHPIDTGGLTLGVPDFPPGELAPDPAGDLPREMYSGDVIIYVPVSPAPGLHSVVFSATHQGCKPGLCFPPKTQELTSIVRSPAEVP